MKVGFAARLAWREGRHGIRRIGVYMTSITLGVAALVSIHSFRDDVARSVQEEADVLMGANARFSSSRDFPDSVASVLDSLSGQGIRVARVTTALSMVMGRPGEEVRLLQVRGVSGGYPFYGTVRTDPEGRWGAGTGPGRAVVDPAVLTQLGVAVGDTLVVGRAHVVIAATARDLPTDLGFQTAVGPRVFVSMATLEEAELLGFGSLARYEAFLDLPDPVAREALRTRYGDVLSAAQVSYTLAEEQARRLSNSIRFLGRFLGLVGLGALLLGGIGVASAIHVYIKERQAGVAVLRCIGADQWTLFLAYLIQAATLGFLGAAAGVVAGVAAQHLLPVLFAGTLPVEVDPRFSPTAAWTGLGIGVWVASIFALLPLLRVRDVPPLRALRQDVEAPTRRWDVGRGLAWVTLLGSVAALSALEAPDESAGVLFAGALVVAAGALAATGWLLARVVRRLVPRSAPYPLRQGVSNLFRPRNQTVAVTLALGFGAFIVGTLVEVEGNLLDDLDVSFGQGRPNVLLFDIQPDQLDGVVELLPEAYRDGADVMPLVPSRLIGINGLPYSELLDDSIPPERRPERWALRREYRNTFREHLGPAEELVAGTWWDGTTAEEDSREVDTGTLPGVSLEVDLAADLKVGLGDTLIWLVSGIRVPSVVTSLRSVDWERLEPNFFAVLEPGSLDEAPRSLILVARLPDAGQRAELQRRLVEAYPNVSALDFSRVQEAIDGLLSRVRQAVGFLGAFSALAGLLVLMGALATSRGQRTREGALLKTLGASRRQVLAVLLSEYLAIGTLATATGLGLAWIAAALVVPRAFEMEFTLHPIPLLVIWGAVAGLTVGVGLATSRSLLTRPPLAVLREAPE